MISNRPTAGEWREFQEINALYITLNKMMRKKEGWSVYIPTADEKFPYFKRGRPDRVRKLFNGNIRVDYYQYYGETIGSAAPLTPSVLRQTPEPLASRSPGLPLMRVSVHNSASPSSAIMPASCAS